MMKAKIDFISVSCYRSNNAYESKVDSERQEYSLNKFRIKGQMQWPNIPGDLYSITNGTLISIEKVKDEMFAKKMMGDGVAFLSVQARLFHLVTELFQPYLKPIIP